MKEWLRERVQTMLDAAHEFGPSDPDPAARAKWVQQLQSLADSCTPGSTPGKRGRDSDAAHALGPAPKHLRAAAPTGGVGTPSPPAAAPARPSAYAAAAPMGGPAPPASSAASPRPSAYAPAAPTGGAAPPASSVGAPRPSAYAAGDPTSAPPSLTPFEPPAVAAPSASPTAPPQDPAGASVPPPAPVEAPEAELGQYSHYKCPSCPKMSATLVSIVDHGAQCNHLDLWQFMDLTACRKCGAVLADPDDIRVVCEASAARGCTLGAEGKGGRDVRWDEVGWGGVGWGDVRWGDVRWGGVRWGGVG